MEDMEEAVMGKKDPSFKPNASASTNATSFNGSL